jgi:hypothetical protein
MEMAGESSKTVGLAAARTVVSSESSTPDDRFTFVPSGLIREMFTSESKVCLNPQRDRHLA